MRTLMITVAASAALLTAGVARADEAQSTGSAPDDSLAASAKATEVGIRVTAAVIAIPLRVAADASGAVLKQTFLGLGDGSRADPFAGTALRVDDEVVVKAQPAPVVPREVPAR